LLIGGVPEGLDARLIAENLGVSGRMHLHIARDDARLAQLADTFAYFTPSLGIARFPAWDCLPYDRVSPHTDVSSVRIATLARLAERELDESEPLVVLTTVNAVLQRVVPRTEIRRATRRLVPGDAVDLDEMVADLQRGGYVRASTVREPGEFAIRGGIMDVFPAGAAAPLRLDLFGDTLEGIRTFDPASQRTLDRRESVALGPISEVTLGAEAIERFRIGYRSHFGQVGDDPLYLAVSEGRRQIGIEHWLPLFNDRLETLFDYLPDATVTLDHQTDETRSGRLETIADYYDSRRTFLETRPKTVARTGEDVAPPYRPLPPDLLYLSEADWNTTLAGRGVGQFSPYAAPPAAPEGFAAVVDYGGRRVYDFATARAQSRSATEESGANVFDLVRDYVRLAQEEGKRVIVAAFSNGSRERLRHLLVEHGVASVVPADTWNDVTALKPGTTAVSTLGLDHGFATDDLAVIGEQDILGERLIRSARRRRRPENFIADAAELAAGDLVVHVEHGIGRYDGLETISVSDAPHDCLRLTYAGDDRLYVPVENVELLSRYGSGDSATPLDRLGSAAWQSRKARLKRRLRDMAAELIKIAAARTLRLAPEIDKAAGLYEEFCARFPYVETDDQVRAIDETLGDLGSGRPMDRLICGDVGFGKTEVALRAAFNAVISGGQVAVIVPTTLLCRQHFATFRDRFADTAARIEQLSRFVSAKDAAETKRRMAEGRVDIVIGTHALLAPNIRFKNLTLLIIDEEQHFGVKHKERLKQLRAEVHVLTLTATPIPRTLQLALAGVRDMSVIATPPVDRLAVRTFVLPYDPIVIREAIMREHFRGGQVFYVCPRIEDLAGVADRLRDLVPEIRIGMAHGRLPVRALEEVMTAFYERRLDLLLSTQIIESGLDIPTVNTMVVHRADMFGLAQLYQLRGRIGRSKLRAYCYLTLPPAAVLTSAAHKRLEVMQTLDTLGAGFTLASHDLDIRGAGNLLGEEQSGHIREVGVELYQQLLEEAVAEARGAPSPAADGWTPQINVGIPVLIPENYVTDLDVRLGLYRRIAAIEDESESEAFAAEMIDRFGPLPPELENLIKVVAIKRVCRAAGIEKIDVGPKGATIAFRNNEFANPAGLVRFITEDAGRTKLRPDHRLVCRRDWDLTQSRLAGAERLLKQLADIATKASKAA
jgi:transcription-repair coupling factor (superfamily II helicase)